jgi:hypothetical protein
LLRRRRRCQAKRLTAGRQYVLHLRFAQEAIEQEDGAIGAWDWLPELLPRQTRENAGMQ